MSLLNGDTSQEREKIIVDQQLDFLNDIESDINLAGGPVSLPNDGRIGVTMFDMGSSKTI
jgi:hypothetical protein